MPYRHIMVYCEYGIGGDLVKGTRLKMDSHDPRVEIHLPAVIDLPAASQLRDALQDALAHDTSAEVALSAGGVERIGTAGVQVILAAAAAFKAAARHLTVEGAPAPMRDAFRILGVAGDIELLV